MLVYDIIPEFRLDIIPLDTIPFSLNEQPNLIDKIGDSVNCPNEKVGETPRWHTVDKLENSFVQVRCRNVYYIRDNEIEQNFKKYETLLSKQMFLFVDEKLKWCIVLDEKSIFS